MDTFVSDVIVTRLARPDAAALLVPERGDDVKRRHGCDVGGPAAGAGKRAVVDLLAEVRVLPTRKGAQSFHPHAVRITWETGR